MPDATALAECKNHACFLTARSQAYRSTSSVMQKVLGTVYPVNSFTRPLDWKHQTSLGSVMTEECRDSSNPASTSPSCRCRDTICGNTLRRPCPHLLDMALYPNMHMYCKQNYEHALCGYVCVRVKTILQMYIHAYMHTYTYTQHIIA